MIPAYYHKTLQSHNPTTTSNIHKYRWYKEGRTTPIRRKDSFEEDLKKVDLTTGKTRQRTEWNREASSGLSRLEAGCSTGVMMMMMMMDLPAT
jgi:hypothetical protein